jgi:hypothetical protein
MPGRSTISDVFTLYDKALTQTRSKLESGALESTRELESFYNEFLKTQIHNYGSLFENEGVRNEIHRNLEQRHRSSQLRFWAVDGACRKVETSDIVIFYGGAYLIKGRLGLLDRPPLIQYEESEPEDDSSIVAYLPLSAEDLTMIDPEDRFVVNDAERISITGLDTQLMLLAEIFLLYRGATSPDHPHLILWDHSFSSMLANATPNVLKLRFAGLKMAGEIIWYPDLLVGYSKPWNKELDIPSKKSHRLWERAIAKLFESPSHMLDITEFSKEVNLSQTKVETQIGLIWECDKHGKKWDGKKFAKKNPSDALTKKDGNILYLNPEYLHAPEKIKRLYEYFCNRFFRDKDPSVLLYDYEDENGFIRQRFLSSEEISFLLALGIRLTFENCWQNEVMLIGVVKDSASTYYTNHYFGVMKKIGAFNFTPKKIPVTDRLTLERLPYIDGTIKSPWATTEFDGVFMTLRMKKEWPTDEPTIQGIRGNVLVQPNLIMRSLVQFYLKNEPPMEPMMGHVIFVDRLVHPHSIPDVVTVVDGDKELGTVEPFFFRDSSIRNKEQEYMIYLLSVLTRNVFPEVIGYPDPLHHADRGAKSVLKMVEPMLFSSERLNRSNPLHKTLRQLRGG